MQSLTNTRTVTIRFASEKDRVSGLYEMFNSNLRSSSLGNNEYEVNKEHLDVFKRHDIKYKIIPER